MNIIFWGTPKFSVPIFETIYNSNHNILAVVTQPDKRRTRGRKESSSPIKKKAIELDIPCYTPQNIKHDIDIQRQIKAIEADIFVVVAFGQILPKEVLISPKKGSWNIHASLLPKWRGAAPINRSIINGDKFTGVGIMLMEEGLDTGPILIEGKIKIDQLDNSCSLGEKLNKLASKLILDALSTIEERNFNSEIPALLKPQSSFTEREKCYAKMIKKSEYKIDWNSTESSISTMIRGLYPNAYTVYRSKRLKILESIPITKSYSESLERYHIDYSKYKALVDKKPGYITNEIKNLGFIVSTSEYPILVTKAQLEGKNVAEKNDLLQQLSINNELIKLE